MHQRSQLSQLKQISLTQGFSIRLVAVSALGNHNGNKLCEYAPKTIGQDM